MVKTMKSMTVVSTPSTWKRLVELVALTFLLTLASDEAVLAGHFKVTTRPSISWWEYEARILRGANETQELIDILTEEHDEQRLPDPSLWPHRPVYVRAHRETSVKRTRRSAESAALPLGIEVEFESSIFKGKMILRLRNVDQSDNPDGDLAYFRGNHRVAQFVVQGRFKESMSMADVYEGNQYDRPFKGIPKFAEKMMKKALAGLAPGTQIDLLSENPHIITILASSAQTMSVNRPGEEPDITGPIIPENTSMLGRFFKSNTERQKYFSKPHNAVKYTYNTDDVYSFEFYQEVIDFGTYEVHLPFGLNFDLGKAMDGQPFSQSAMTKNGQFLYDFTIWHENLIKETNR